MQANWGIIWHGLTEIRKDPTGRLPLKKREIESPELRQSISGDEINSGTGKRELKEEGTKMV